MNLAELFAHQGNLQQARFFYQKGLTVAQQHHWREGEAAASLNLGQVPRNEPGVAAPAPSNTAAAAFSLVHASRHLLR